MDTLDTLAFSYRLVFGSFQLSDWVWAAFSFLISFVVVGLFWGVAWNRKWGFSANISFTAVSFLFALAIAATTLGWLGSSRAKTWVGEQRDRLNRQLPSSGTFNREAFRSAWTKLEPLSSQGDRVSPLQGGNSIQVSNENEAKLVAMAAAETSKRFLEREPPFSFGAPCTLRDPAKVAEEAAAAVPSASFPVEITPNNLWAREAIILQVTTAIDSASRALEKPLSELRVALVWIGFLLLVLQVGLVALTAYHDIETHPKA